MRILLGLVVLASGLTGALSYPEKNLVVAEAVSPPGAEPDSETQVRYAVVKGDREQVHEGAVRAASVEFDHPVRIIPICWPLLSGSSAFLDYAAPRALG